MSVMTTDRAPARRATAAAIMPMGPAPGPRASPPLPPHCCPFFTAFPERREPRPDVVRYVIGERHDVEGGDAQILGEGALPVDTDADGAGIEVKAARTCGIAIEINDVPFPRHALADV